MPKKVKEMSAQEVRDISHSGSANNETFAVGGVAGLLLQVTPTDARSWILRTMAGGKRRNIGLGGFPDVSLRDARENARTAKAKIVAGIDPVEEKRKARADLIASQKRNLTFADATDAYLESKLAEFRNEKHKAQWRSTILNYAIPEIGTMMVGEIKTADVQRIVAPIWSTKNETARRLRGRIEKVLDFATVQGHRTGENPARWKGNLEMTLPKISKAKRVQNFPALQVKDAPEWFVDVRSRDGIATRALEFCALTAARSGEIRGALWSEIDLEARVWVVPADKMKAQREHRTPLTEVMVNLLNQLPRINDLVFPAARGGKLSDAALSACMKRISSAREGGYVDRSSGRPAVPHGLRSCFRDWCAEMTTYPREMAEMALAHDVGTEVERAYRRGDMMERRRELMRDWNAFLEGREHSNIVTLFEVTS